MLKLKKYCKRLYRNKIKSDVLGSYTGVPSYPYDLPVQDADDL